MIDMADIHDIQGRRKPRSATWTGLRAMTRAYDREPARVRPWQASLGVLIADRHAAAGRMPQAQGWYRRVLAAKPFDRAATAGLAAVLRKGGDAESADRLCRSWPSGPAARRAARPASRRDRRPDARAGRRFDDMALGHDHRLFADIGDVGERIGGEQDQVGELARLDGAELVGLAGAIAPLWVPAMIAWDRVMPSSTRPSMAASAPVPGSNSAGRGGGGTPARRR